MKIVAILTLAAAMGLAFVAGCDRQDREKVDKWIRQLKADSAELRAEAARKLNELKADSKEVVDALGGAVRDKSEKVRQAASEALADIRDSEAYQTLKNAAQEGVQEAKRAYDNGLRNLRQAAREGKQEAKDLLQKIGEALEDAGEATKDAVKDAGKAVMDATKEAAEETKEGMDKAGKAVKDATTEPAEKK